MYNNAFSREHLSKTTEQLSDFGTHFSPNLFTLIIQHLREFTMRYLIVLGKKNQRN